MSHGPALLPLAPAHLAGLGALQAAAALAFVDLRLAALPLVLFIAACLAAPFFPRSKFYLPVVSRGARRRSAVALTFDDGPDPATTPLLLDLLARHGVPAAFFVTGERAAAHPGLVKAIIAGGHEVGNHSHHHSPLLMLKSPRTLREEILSAQAALAALGIVPFAFRPPVGITSPRLWRVLLEAGMFCVNFSCRARDAGNRRIRALAERILGKARPGDIILLHDVAPGSRFDTGAWLGEIEKILAGLRGKGIGIIPLSSLLGRPVMAGESGRTAAGPVRAFYDGIARGYDAEQAGPGAAPAAVKEVELFERNFLTLISPADRVLEIGAGTGRFTLPLARRCREVTAVDVSPAMLARLEEKAAADNAGAITCRTGDIATIELTGLYDAACSFSSFEYIPDLGALVAAVAAHLRPDGIFYFTTAHRSFFRFFTQVGNAMRQGIWLRARTEKSVRRDLAAAGFVPERIATHVLKLPLSGGILLEALARKGGHGPAGFFS